MRCTLALSWSLAVFASETSPASLRGGRTSPSNGTADVSVTLNETLSVMLNETLSVNLSESLGGSFDGFDLEPLDQDRNDSAVMSADFAKLLPNESALILNGTESSLLDLASTQYGGWSWGGDKVWGHGHGIEEVNRGNVHYYNGGMWKARSGCSDANCALIVNPSGHRTVQVFHIHAVHFASYGAHLKHRMERLVCGHDGWRHGGLPCHGKAAYFTGFPSVFSVGMSGGGMGHASLIAWPSSCGGRGTIVQLAYGCSIEHQIRGDYDPSRR